MMKKITAVLLCIAMLLSAALAAEVSPNKVTIGTISINGAFTLQCGLPEGYYPIPVRATQDHVIAVIRSTDPEAPMMTLSVAFDETYADVDRMNDLDQEALTLLEETFIQDDPGVEITYGETGYGTLLMIARHETEYLDYIVFLSIYKGYFVEFVLIPSETAADKNLTDDQLRVSIDFLTELDFIPTVLPSNGNKQTVAGQTLLTNLMNYDEETNMLRAEIMRPIRLDPETVEALQVGDTLTIGQDSVEIETLEEDEEGDLMVNGEILLQFLDGEVRVSMYEHEYTEIIATLNLEIPENLVFLDHIDPETGEPLDEPTEHTAAELAEMLKADGYPDFSSDNVYVTYDANGEMAQVNRYYTPWQ